VAKCSTAVLDRLGAALEARVDGSGSAARPGVVGLVESAEALRDLSSMARNPIVTTFGIGEVDLLADLRLARTHRSAAAIDGLRTQVVLHCAAAGLSAPVAPTSTAFRDLEAFRESTRHLHDLGFRSRTAVHPLQVPVIHEVLTPDQAAVEAARDILARFERAGGGVTTDERGRLIDAAVVREARETMSRASRG
jgi:citrate lyase subunit beta/citryl-CoA lyase